MNKKITTVIATAIVAALALTGCTNNDEYLERKEKQNTTTLESSLEIANLQEKLERENDPTTIRYVYLMNFGQIVGYYTIKGKVSSNGSQLAPEQEVIRYWGEPNVLDSAQDDGTYGTGDPGIFFYTTEGIMVTTSLDHIQSDAPLPIDVPRLDTTP